VAHHEDERTTIHGVLDMLVENGLEGMADATETMLNEAMKIGRSTALRAKPGEWSPERLGYATVLSRRGFRVAPGFSPCRSRRSDPCRAGTRSSSILRA